jgi:hypothetical protein
MIRAVNKGAPLGGTLLVAFMLAAWGCSSVEVVRLQPDLLKTPRGTEPLAGIQASCIGFYVFTLGAPECDLDRVVNELLMKKARQIGAKNLTVLRFSGTPETGVWWLTKLLWFRTARATAIAVMASDDDDAVSAPTPAKTPSVATQPATQPAATQPGSRPAAPRSRATQAPSATSPSTAPEKGTPR